MHLVPLKQESTSSFEHKNLPPILGSLTDKFSSKFLLRQYNSYTNGLTHLMRGKFSVAPIIFKQHCFTYLLSKNTASPTLLYSLSQMSILSSLSLSIVFYPPLRVFLSKYKETWSSQNDVVWMYIIGANKIFFPPDKLLHWWF